MSNQNLREDLIAILNAAINAVAAERTGSILTNNVIAVDEAGIEAVRRGYAYIMQATKEPDNNPIATGKAIMDFVIKMRDDYINSNAASHSNCLIKSSPTATNHRLTKSALQTLQESRTKIPEIAFLSQETNGTATLFDNEIIISKQAAIQIKTKPNVCNLVIALVEKY
ncbi:MAG: hypothetical protein LBU65_13475 [Planctomycetaceae bacterium]|jgi:hypothetical protein|nr:hypothetical protein [Planctomycetaceae bacterium]